MFLKNLFAKKTFFQNISDFNNTSDYLSIFNGVLITDLIVILLLLIGWINSKVLKTWYRKLNLSAVLADVLIIFIGIILTRFLYPFIFKQYSLIKFIGLAIFIQIIQKNSLFYEVFSKIDKIIYMKSIFGTLLLAFAAFNISAQSFKISGTVIDSVSQSPAVVEVP